VIAGEVLSPANTPARIKEKTAKYAEAGIPFYWEVEIATDPRHVVSLDIYALEVSSVLPPGVVPLRPRAYVQTGHWEHRHGLDIDYHLPFPIGIAWDALEF